MTGPGTTGLFIVEDHPVTRSGFRAVLEPQYEVVGEADNVIDSIDMIRERDPALVVLDVRIREGHGADVIEAVRKTHPEIKFLAVTVSTSREDVVRLAAAGVDGYLTKDAREDELLEAVGQTLGGGRPIDRRVAKYFLEIDDDASAGRGLPEPSGMQLLTERERQVVAMIVRGYTYRQTARDLGMAVKTLETHINRIFRKLEIQSRHELTRRAYGEGFIEPGD